MSGDYIPSPNPSQKSSPAPAPVLNAAIVAALKDSVVELQTLRKKLFANDQRAAGMVLAQLNAIYGRLLQGLPSRRSDYLTLLHAASRLPKGQAPLFRGEGDV